jgi:hypothetical protein
VDVYNNPITTEIQFVVVGESVLVSNPFVNYTEFWFTHNRPFEPLMVQIQVMTITGKSGQKIKLFQLKDFYQRDHLGR